MEPPFYTRLIVIAGRNRIDTTAKEKSIVIHKERKSVETNLKKSALTRNRVHSIIAAESYVSLS